MRALLSLIFMLMIAGNLFAKQSDLPYVPMPKSIKSLDGTMPLTCASQIVATDKKLLPLATVLAKEIEVTKGLTLKPVVARKGRKGDIVLKLDKKMTGEEYQLSVAKTATVKAGNYQALAQGTVTLLQALIGKGEKLILKKVEIMDSPDAGYRGLMIDVARQTHSVENLKEIIQLCRIYKVRYLQLHLSDDQAFTFPCKKYPKIVSAKRSYTIEQIKDLVKYADERGVTIVPEIDLPAHASAICKAMPELFKSPSGGIINFASEEATQAAGDIIDEVAEVFKSSPYIHLGADEANLSGLSSNPQFKKAIEDNKVHGISGLFNFFLNKMNARVKAHGKSMIAWEGFHINKGPSKLDTDVIVMPFDNYVNAESYYIKAGHRVINTSWYPLYNIVNDPMTKQIYDWDLYTFGNYTGLPRRYWVVRQYQVTSKDKVLGAQVCSWEQRQETEIAQQRLPLAAMAERTWNIEKTADYAEFLRRVKQTDKLLDAFVTKSVPSPVTPTASDSVYADGIMVRWNKGDNYCNQYTLLRAETDDVNVAKEIAKDLAEGEFYDKTAAKGQSYYYWVKGRNNLLGYGKTGKSSKGSIGSATKIVQAYEGFAYPADAVVAGLNGGKGWKDTWKITTQPAKMQDDENTGKVIIKKEGLSYKGLQTTGGCINVSYSKDTNNRIFAARETAETMGISGADFWVSYLIRGNKIGSGHCFVGVNDCQTGKSWGNGLGVANHKFHLLEKNKTTLVVIYVSLMDGKDIYRMWVNPSLDQAPSFSEYDMAYCDKYDFKKGNKITLNVQPHGKGNYDFDEIRLGRTWEEVTPKQ